MPSAAAQSAGWRAVPAVARTGGTVRTPATVAAAAAKLATGPREAIAATKRAVNASTLAGLDDALRRETESQVILLKTDDHREGVDAMLGKRPARFTD